MTAALSRSRARSSPASQASRGCAASSAAAVGVGARTSAQKSAMVKSVSWPTPQTSGTGLCTMVRASCSSLKAQRSSIEPPPRTSRIASIVPASARRYSALQGANQLGRCLRALHRRRCEDHGHMRRAPSQGRHHIVQRRRLRRRDHANAPRQQRRHALAAGIEQALRFQPGFQPQELLDTARLARPAAGSRRSIADRHAARTPPGGPAPRRCRRRAARNRAGWRRAGTWRSELALAVLQREVAMPAGSARKARNLAAHRDRD